MHISKFLISLHLKLLGTTSISSMPKVCQINSEGQKSENDSTCVISYKRVMALIYLNDIDYKDETEDATLYLTEDGLEIVRRKISHFLSVLMDEKKALRCKRNVKFACEMMDVQREATKRNITLNISDLMKRKMKINELKAAIYAKGGKPGKFKNKHELIQKFLKLTVLK